MSSSRKPDEAHAATFSGITLCNIGPAVQSGRIADIVKDPQNQSTWYVAVASGNVWKTVNNGTTWSPIFENYGSFSTGSLAIDPRNSNVVWLGTGENASQRSAGFGDGIYQTLDGGKSWQNMGLRESEHIAKILIDPRNSDVVYAASQGPLWAPGGDRRLFKTTDGGASWKQLSRGLPSADRGRIAIAVSPIQPDVVYALVAAAGDETGIVATSGSS